VQRRSSSARAGVECIEIDKHTADALQARAAELGMTVPQLIAELAALDGVPREADDDEVAELDRRFARATEGSRAPHARVVRWLRTWGTREFRPWPGPDLAKRVGRELITRAEVLRRHPKLGRAIKGREEYRGYEGRTIMMLRAFHGREAR